MKTHKVIDLFYTEDEGNSAFTGTFVECQDFVSDQGGIGYQIVQLSESEFKLHNA